MRTLFIALLPLPFEGKHMNVVPPPPSLFKTNLTVWKILCKLFGENSSQYGFITIYHLVYPDCFEI